jgi:hypothetical protein
LGAVAIVALAALGGCGTSQTTASVTPPAAQPGLGSVRSQNAFTLHTEVLTFGAGQPVALDLNARAPAGTLVIVDGVGLQSPSETQILLTVAGYAPAANETQTGLSDSVAANATATIRCAGCAREGPSLKLTAELPAGALVSRQLCAIGMTDEFPEPGTTVQIDDGAAAPVAATGSLLARLRYDLGGPCIPPAGRSIVLSTEAEAGEVADKAELGLALCTPSMTVRSLPAHAVLNSTTERRSAHPAIGIATVACTNAASDAHDSWLWSNPASGNPVHPSSSTMPARIGTQTLLHEIDPTFAEPVATSPVSHLVGAYVFERLVENEVDKLVKALLPGRDPNGWSSVSIETRGVPGGRIAVYQYLAIAHQTEPGVLIVIPPGFIAGNETPWR